MMRSWILFLFLFVSAYSSAGTWSQRASFGGTGRHRAVGMSIFNKGYLGLGHVNGSGTDISYKDWWQYDPASNSWAQKADYPFANHGAVGFSIDKKGYVGGGSYLNGEFYCYDPTLNTWSAIPVCPLSPGESQGFCVNGKGYVYLGNQIAEFDPVANSWTLKANSPLSFGNWTCAFAIGSSGFIKSGIYLYEFKPSQNAWVPRSSFPGLMSNGSSAFVVDNKGYVTCGYSGGLSTVVDEVWEYNPGSDVWTQVEDFPGTNRRFPVAFSVNNIGYFGTGTNGINMNDFWEYDPRDLNVEELENIMISIYPNPASEKVVIELPQSIHNDISRLSYQLISIDGRICRNDRIENTEFSIAKDDLLSGVYVLSISVDGKKVKQERIIFN